MSADEQPQIQPNRRERRNKRFRPKIKPAAPWSIAPNSLIHPSGKKPQSTPGQSA